MIKQSALSATGKNPFHVSPISRSYRNRGKVARAQTKKNEKNRVFINKIISSEIRNLLPPKKSAAVSILINRMFAYSAIKMRANPPLPYSMLNPDTSSDSPSAKSNGARFVSAMQETSQTKAIGDSKRPNQISPLKDLISKMLNVSLMNRENKRINARLTS